MPWGCITCVIGVLYADFWHFICFIANTESLWAHVKCCGDCSYMLVVFRKSRPPCHHKEFMGFHSKGGVMFASQSWLALWLRPGNHRQNQENHFLVFQTKSDLSAFSREKVLSSFWSAEWHGTESQWSHFMCPSPQWYFDFKEDLLNSYKRIQTTRLSLGADVLMSIKEAKMSREWKSIPFWR